MSSHSASLKSPWVVRHVGTIGRVRSVTFAFYRQTTPTPTRSDHSAGQTIRTASQSDHQTDAERRIGVQRIEPTAQSIDQFVVRPGTIGTLTNAGCVVEPARGSGKEIIADLDCLAVDIDQVYGLMLTDRGRRTEDVQETLAFPEVDQVREEQLRVRIGPSRFRFQRALPTYVPRRYVGECSGRQARGTVREQLRR